MKGVVFAFLCLLAVTVQSEKNVESELRRLPKLFHLDDYEACMERDNGIYCLGKFQIYSDEENNPLFDLIQEKAQDIHLFNRSFIHRGYCLTTRCAIAEANVTTRFERCVDTWARKHALRTRLHELHYCKTAGKPLPIEKNTDMPHQLLLYFVYGILALNLIGTVYDVMFRTGEGNFILMAFSFPANWKKFGTISDDSDPRINNLQVLYGIRTWFMCTAIAAHVGLVVCMVYQHNPRFFEKLLASRAGSTLGASTTITQAYIVMSNFLTAFSLISVSAKHKIGLRTIPVLVLKRAIRLYPIYLTVNAFAATWWTNVGQGPMWPLVVGGESAICRKKFWLTTVFLQNIVDPEQVCLVQTWIMAVDMQLQVATMVLVLLLLKRREWAMPVLYAVFAAVTALTTAVAFNKEYLPLFNVVTPDNFQSLFRNEKSFTGLFQSPVNCVMTAVGGVILAFLYVDHQERGIKISKSKLLVFLHYMAFPALAGWSYFCSILNETITSPTTMMLIVTIDRLVVTLLECFIMYTMMSLKSCYQAAFSWKPLRITMRLSFAVSMVHWCVNVAMVANRQTLHDSSFMGLALDFLGTLVISLLIALPLTLLVEYPLKKVLDRLVPLT